MNNTTHHPKLHCKLVLSVTFDPLESREQNYGHERKDSFLSVKLSFTAEQCFSMTKANVGTICLIICLCLRYLYYYYVVPSRYMAFYRTEEEESLPQGVYKL